MIGVQLFGLSDLLKKDRRASLQRLRDMGIEAVEPYLPLKKDNLADFEILFDELKDLGLSVPSIHVSPSLFGRQAAKISRELRLIQEKTSISVFVFSGMFSREKSAQKWGRLLGDVSKEVRSNGITVLYHNHNMEFLPAADGGRTALDVFFDAAGNDVKLQLDIGWAGIAGDEIAFAEKNADRIVEIHCKDFYEGAKEKYSLFIMPKSMFAPIGEGVIKTKEILSRRNTFPNFNGVVLIDQDQSAGSLLEDIETGFHNLKEILS